MSRLTRLRGLARDARGATLAEFALIAPVMCALLVGVLDLGYRTYVTSIVQGSLHEASRMATVGNVPIATIDAHVKARLQEFSRDATITTTTQSYSDFNGVTVPEPITQDTAPTGSYNPGDCFSDINGNGSFDLDRGRSGMGGAEDVVKFQVRMVYPRMFPVAAFFGASNNVEIVRNTVLRNQPFAGRSIPTPATIC